MVAVSFLDLLFLPTLQYPPFHRIFQNSSLYIFTEQKQAHVKRKKFMWVLLSFNGLFTWVVRWILVESSELPRFVSTEGPVNRGISIYGILFIVKPNFILFEKRDLVNIWGLAQEIGDGKFIILMIRIRSKGTTTQISPNKLHKR